MHGEIGKQPKNIESDAQMMQTGLEDNFDKTFQLWNSYVNGSITELSGAMATLDGHGGFDLRSGDDKDIVEHLDRNLLLVSIRQKTARGERTTKPHFIDTPSGKLIDMIPTSEIIPITAHDILHIQYATVSGYSIPLVVHCSKRGWRMASSPSR